MFLEEEEEEEETRWLPVCLANVLMMSGGSEGAVGGMESCLRRRLRTS